MLDSFIKGQILWYNNIEFTASGNRRVDYKPELFKIENFDFRSYYSYLLISSVGRNLAIRICIPNNRFNDYFHTTRVESIRSYNSKIDKEIERIRDIGGDTSMEIISSLFKGAELIGLNEDAEPLSLDAILNLEKKSPGSAEHPLGYMILLGKYCGLTLPRYAVRVRTIASSEENIVAGSNWLGKNIIKKCKYGENVLNSIYGSKEDLFIGFDRDFDVILEFINHQVENRINKLEKQKILI